MSISGFDPKQFLEGTFNEASSTERIPIPAKEYTAVIESVDCRAWVGKQDPSKSGLALDVVYNIDDAEAKTLTGRDKLTIQQGIMLDLTPAKGLDFSKGRNVELGRLREAAGLNEPGKPFGFRMLQGRVVKVMVGHQPSTRPGARPGDVFENVVAVARA